MRRRLAVAIRGLGVGIGAVRPGHAERACERQQVHTSGLTAGFDWRAAENFIAGFAIGYGGDRTDVGINGTRSSATSLSATAYASWKPFDTWFVDAMLGYGTISYDNRRFVTDDGSTADGTRRGTSWFGAISTGYDVRYGALKLTPYVRADFMQARLNEYSEQGATAALLTYGAMRFQTVAGAVGLRAGYDIPMSFGTVTPMARVEYRQAFDGAFSQPVYYTDLGAGTSSTVAQAASNHGTINTSAGLRVRSFSGISGELEYGTSAVPGKVQSQTVRAALRMAF